jgi:hypothetical protein
MTIKQIFPLVMLILCIPSIAHLQTDSLKLNNRKYKREIDINMAGLFSGNPGGALIFKIRNDRGKLVPIGYAKNYRFLLSENGSLPFGQKFYGENNEPLIADKIDYQSVNVSALVGIERVDFYKKINLYYGIDVGLIYNNNRSYFGYYFINQNNQWEYYANAQTSNSYGVTSIPFYGLKYRLNERFSISLESAASVTFNHIITKYDDGVNSINVRGLIKETVGNRIDFNFMPLRFLTFNYHIRKY